MEALTQNLVPIDLSLEEIFLDPNNPRFGEIDSPFVPEEEIDQEHHQARAISRLLKEFGADKLKINMQINGYLPIDRIIVREFSDGKYVVLEGNRRIASAKTIKKYDDDGKAISDDVILSLKKIPCLKYIGGGYQCGVDIPRTASHNRR